MKNILCIFLLSINFSVFAQTPSPQVQNLASKITGGVSKDSLKVRAIYEWITDNIGYDIGLARQTASKSVEEFIELQQPEQVLASKKAVCMGYSILFKDLCTSLGIKSQYITGYCKNDDLQGNSNDISDMLHAWNAVKLNGKWYLCDLTWSSGAIDLAEGRFYKKRNEKFYLSSSQEFVKRHLPYDPVWQLSNEPLTLNEFRLGNEASPSRRRTPKLNFADSLSVYETQDPETQKLNSYRRALQFDPSNDEAKAAIGYYFAMKAGKTGKAYNDLVLTFMNKNTEEAYRKALTIIPKVLELLGSAEQEIRWAKYYYEQIPINSKFGQVARVNKQNAEQFISVISQNRGNMNKYHDYVKTRVRR